MLQKEIKNAQLPYLTADMVKANKTVVFTETIYPEIKDTVYKDKKTGVETHSDKLHCSVKCGDEEFHWTPNNTTKDSIIDLLGSDESKYVSKEIELGTLKQQVGDGIRDVIYTKAWLESQDS